jgi:hypothetical protein
MSRVSDREFIFDEQALAKFCRHFEFKWDRIKRFADQASKASARAHVELSAYFPGVLPTALRTSLELRTLWPSERSRSNYARAYKPSFAIFGWDLAEALAFAVAYQGKALAIDRVIRGLRMPPPWRALAPLAALSWFPPFLTETPHGRKPAAMRVLVGDVLPSPSEDALEWKKRHEEGRDKIIAARDHYDAMILDRAGAGRPADGPVYEVVSRLNDLLQKVVPWCQELDEIVGSRKTGAAAYHLETFSEIAVTLALAINRAVPARDKRVDPSEQRQPVGFYRAVCLDGACRLLKAIYGLEMPSPALKSKLQDQEERSFK